MSFLLSDRNVVNYLQTRQIIDEHEIENIISIEPKICKNFNLKIDLSDYKQLLIKQEPHDFQGQTKGDFQHESLLYESLEHFSELDRFKRFFPEAIYFDSSNAILVFNYLTDYGDLDEFYTRHNIFPTKIAESLGIAIAEIHSLTLDKSNYKSFWQAKEEDIDRLPDFSKNLARIYPEIFGKISSDGLKFYELYQRDKYLAQAISNLNETYTPCCSIHDDLKFDNILLHTRWSQLPVDDSNFLSQKSQPSIIRAIDWERWSWGDPALDLATIIANYLKLWLKSAIVNPNLEIELALSLAATPLEKIQPSLVTLIQTYCRHFPKILDKFPNFLTRVMQFTGLGLIDSIQAKLYYYEPFNNTSIAMLQVAKSLLCNPEESIVTVFGLTAAEILNSDYQLSIDPKLEELLSIPSPLQSQPNLSSQQISLSFLKSDLQDLVIRDIVDRIKIQADYTISHLHYQPLTVPNKLCNCLQKLPPLLKEKYLSYQLRNYLYDIYFSGEQESISVNAEANLTTEFANNLQRGINLDFYQQLDGSNCGSGYFDRDWLVLSQPDKDTILVQKNGLTLHIDVNRHLSVNHQLPQIGKTIAIRLPYNRIEAGFYVAVGDAGSIEDNLCTIEIYFNVAPQGAIKLMEHLSDRLNNSKIPFSFAVLMNPDEYNRYDAGNLRIEQNRYPSIQPLLQEVYRQTQTYFRPETPVFTKKMAKGLGLAETPTNPPHDFGLNRCQLIADALLTAWKTGDESPENRLNSIERAFYDSRIDLKHPYLNPDSDDIYSPLV